MIKTIKLADIISDDNRKYTKDDGFKQLVSSIKQHGVIEQPVVRELADGRYKIIAGRRRIAALRELKEIDTECTVYAADDPGSDEEIALAENVNRLEMHPLDEAALFGRMADKGMSVEEIAKYYARSPSAIYKRLRLVRLNEELKGMFRDGVLNIDGAALLAELPEEDQKEFYNLHGAETEDEDEDDEHVEKTIAIHTISGFIYKKQKNSIEDSMKETCAGCKKRTHNEDNALFPEESEYFCDVCLDGECYRAKWNAMISAALEAQIVQMRDAGLNTDEKIFIKRGSPERIFKDAGKMILKINKKETEFEVLREKKYDFTGETNRKKDACWQIHTDGDGKIDVRRVGYKEKPPREKPEEKGNGAGKKEAEKIKEYGQEAMKAAANEMQTTPAELVRKLEEKHIWSGKFESDVSDLVVERVVARRLEEETSGKEPQREYLEMFLEMLDEEGYGSDNFLENDFNEKQKKWFSLFFGARNIKRISVGLDDDAQRLFHFLILSIGFRCVPTPEELKKKKNPKDDIFLRYAGMGVEEYTALYLQAAKDVAAAALKPKEKKDTKKKAEIKKKAKGVLVDADDDDDDYPF
jgi:ParB/RepB/Spo0J family partition protein